MSNVEELIASLEDRPDSPEIVEELERELALAESWDQYATALPLFVRNLSDTVQRSRFLIRAAHVCRHYAGFPEIADDLLLEIAEVAMTPEDTVKAVRLAFEPQEDWNGLVAACMDLSELASDDNQRSALIYAVGRTYEDRLYDPERAIHCYQRAFKLNPIITEPLHRARQIYAHADQWSTVEKLYGIELRVVSEGKARARLLKELGYIQMERLGKRDAAIASFDEAVTLDPDMSGLQDVVDNLRAGSGAHGVVIAPQMTESGGHGVDVPDGTRVRSETSAHGAVTEDAPIGLTEEMRVSEVVSFEDSDMSNASVKTQTVASVGFVPELGTQDIVVQPEQVSGSVVDIRPVTASASELVVEEVSDSPPPAPSLDSGVLEAIIEADVSAEQAVVDALDEAEDADLEANEDATEPSNEESEENDAEDSEDAVAEALVDEDDAQLDEEESIERDVSAVGEFESAEEDAQVDEEASDDSDEIAAESAEDAEPIEDAEPAEETTAPTAKAARSQPRKSVSGGVPAVTLSASRESLGASLNAREYIEVLRERARAGDDDGAMSLAFALELALRGDEPEGALAEWVAEGLLDFEDTASAVSALLPAALGQTAFWEALVECLEGLDEDERLGGAQYAARFYALQRFDEASVYSSYAGELGRRDASVMDVAKKGNWRKVQQGLQTELADCGEEAESEAYRAQALIALGLGKVDKAADSIRRVLRGNKKDARALWMHRSLNRNLERWNPVADALKSLAPQVDEAGQRILYRELVDVYRDHLNQPMAVMQSLQKLSDADPDNVGVLDELAEMLEEVNNHRELVGVLRRKAEVVQDVEEKIAIYELVATTFIERFNNQAEALSAYEEVLALDPDNTNALAQLEELYERRREWAKLIDIKKRRVERLDEPAERSAVLASAAEIAATRLRDNEQAEELWNAVVDQDESNEAALEALERLHERAKNWEKLADVLSRRVGTINDDDQRAQTLIKLGQIQSDRLDDAAGSISTWEQLLQVDPENFRAREALKKSYVELEQWDELEAFYGRDDAWADYVRQIEGIAGNHDDPQVAIELLFRAADAWQERLNDELRSTKALEKVLAIDGENTAAARRLVPVYREKEDARRLPGALQIVLMHEKDEDARFDAIVELARLAAGPGRAPAEAVEWFKQALDTQPDAVSLLDEFESVAADASAWSEVRGAYEDARARLDSETQAEAWLDISLRLGHLLDERADDVDSALQCFSAVLEVDPGSLPALDARDRIFTRLGDWDSLLEALEAKLVSTDTPDERVALLERVCLIQEEHREDVEAAISGYNEVLSLAPAHESSLLALHRLYAQTGEAHALAEVLRTLIELRLEAPVERRSLQVELAEACARQLSEFDEAMTLLRTVVSEDPKAPRARALLEELLADDSERVRAARLLEPLYQSEESWAKLVDILEIQVEASTDDESATSMLSRIGRVHAEQLQDPRAASDAYARLLQRDPHSTEAREHLESLAGITGEWTSLLELYESALDMLNPGLERDRTLAIELGTRGAVYHEEKAGEVDEAVRMHRRVLDFSPSRPETLADLAALFTRAERWEELLDVLDEQMQAADDDNTRRGLLMQSAEIRRFRMEDPTASIDEYRRVLDIEPNNHEALDALDALYAETNDSASRAEVLERRVNQAEANSDAQLDLKNRLAAVYEDELGEVPRAMELWRDVLAQDPSNKRAFEGLESQLETTDFAMAASEILEPLYTEQAAPDRLVRLLETRLLHVHTPEARRALYDRIATLHERELRDRPSAIGALMLAAEEFLADTALMERLDALVAVEGSWASYADRLQELASEAADPDARRSTMVRVARVRESELNDAGGAALLWRQVLDEAPSDCDALDALERLDAVLEEWPELIDVLLRKAEQPDAATQAEVFKPLMFRAARLHEEALEQQDEAIEVLRSVLARDPDDSHSIEELERLFTATGRWEDLVENYDRKLRLTDDADAKRELLFALGSVLEREIDDPDRAIDAYRRALDAAPSDLEALRALDRLLLTTENWDGLLQVLEKQTELVEIPEQLLNIRSRMARLLETELFRASDAIALYQGILDEEPSHVPSRQALASLIERGEEAPQAAAILEPIYRSEGAWVELVEINKTRIEHAETIDDRRDLHIDSAEIHEVRLLNVDAALDSYFAATQESLRVTELDHIERLSVVDGDWARVIDLYTDLWDEQSDPSLRRVLGLRTARMQESQAGDAQAAIDTHARLLEEDPSTQDSLNALDRLYASAGSAELLAEILQRRAQIGGVDN
ncbi:MAG: tetratricopeptide (TPR) repeat protein, partial [Bradymonadia bacterium]